MKTFEAIFSYKLDGLLANSRIRVEATDVDAAQRQISEAFQRAVGRPAEPEPDQWTPLVADWVKGLSHVVIGDVMEGALGTKYTGNDVRRVIAILRGLGYEHESGSRYKKTRTPSPLENAHNFVRTAPPAISGQGGHAHTFSVARMLVESPLLSDSDVWALLLEFNQRCQPPWSEVELQSKLNEARKVSGKDQLWTEAVQRYDAGERG